LEKCLVDILSLSSGVDNRNLFAEKHGDFFHVFLLKSFFSKIHFSKSFDDHGRTIVEGGEI